ncbi:uncharacterized protein LOC135392529 [Ornithodoros turicata]|uniref:uncharacterized protein LOC135392529 n=1 Tax=Ornithodoros turicata TaxID=34597 RepID=UPI003138EB35
MMELTVLQSLNADDLSTSTVQYATTTTTFGSTTSQQSLTSTAVTSTTAVDTTVASTTEPDGTTEWKETTFTSESTESSVAVTATESATEPRSTTTEHHAPVTTTEAQKATEQYAATTEGSPAVTTEDGKESTSVPDLFKETAGINPLLKNLSAPCSKRLGTYVERTLKNFPARLPELWEFRRRRFLRAAVVGGLPQIVVERQDVNCNVTSAVTTWDIYFKSQLDGICNLGITGLPRMYLRFTGPLTARARLSAPLSEISKPVLDDVQIVSADVHEIHYQSVLGFEQPFVERASKYLLQRALREEVLGPLKEALKAELENPTLPDRNKVLILDDKTRLDNGNNDVRSMK